MSTIELAVEKVKRLSESQAKTLLNWLSAQEARQKRSGRKTSKRRPKTMRELMAWYDSIRGTTDWEPQRMPNDLGKVVNPWK